MTTYYLYRLVIAPPNGVPFARAETIMFATKSDVYARGFVDLMAVGQVNVDLTVWNGRKGRFDPISLDGDARVAYHDDVVRY